MDVAFKQVYTPAIIKFVYFLALPGLLLIWLVLTIVGFYFGTWLGLLALIIVGPGLLIGGLLVIRVGSELILLVVKAADDIHAMRVAGVSMADTSEG